LVWPPIWRLDDSVAACSELLAAARAREMPVIYSRGVNGAVKARIANPRYVRLRAHRAERLAAVRPAPEEWKRQIMAAVAPQPGEVVLDKPSHSLFDFTGINPLLHNLGVSRLIVAGLQTNVCVEATARGGLTHGFEVAVPRGRGLDRRPGSVLRRTQLHARPLRGDRALAGTA
jgi:ureidoacrylate peracid hydrolase